MDIKRLQIRRLSLSLFLMLMVFKLYGQDYYSLSDSSLLMIEDGKYQKAQLLIKKALKLEPANRYNAVLFTNLGMLEQLKQNEDDALAAYSLALNINPNLKQALLPRASIYFSRNEFKKAFEDYSTILRMDSTNTKALVFRAYIYTFYKKYKDAFKDYKRVLRIDPHSYVGRLGIVMLYQKELKFAESLSLVNELIKEYPNDKTLILTKANILFSLKQFENALHNVNSIIDNDSLSSEAYLLKAQINLSLNDKKNAKKNFIKARELGAPAYQITEGLKHCK